MVFQTTLCKPWGDGLAMHTSCISGLLLRPWHPCHCSFLETLGSAFRHLLLVFCSRIGLSPPLQAGHDSSRYVCCCCFLLASLGRVDILRCLGLFGDSSEVPCHPVRGPLLPPSTLESRLAWVVPARRVAMDTSLLCLKRSGPLPTWKAPVPKLIVWR